MRAIINKSAVNGTVRQAVVQQLQKLLDEADGQPGYHGEIQVSVQVQAGQFVVYRVTPERTYKAPTAG